MEKPRIRIGSVAYMIQSFIADRNQPGARNLGLSHLYTLRTVQRSPIGVKLLGELRPVDFLNHAKMRKVAGVTPQTISHDIMYLSGAIKYGMEILDVPDAEAAYKAFKKAVPQLKKEQLIGKSMPRNRRPTPEELERLLAYFANPPKKDRSNIIPMVPVVKFSYLAGRRISETCRILWADLDHEKRTCMVRDLKNAKGKGFHDTFPLLGEAWDIVMAQPRVGECIFPYNAKSCGAKYTLAKKALGIENLRLHDNRRECFSRMFEAGFGVPEVQKLSLHRNPTILLKNYTALKPEDLHKGPASKRAVSASDQGVEYVNLEKLSEDHPLRNTLLADARAEFKHFSAEEFTPVEPGRPMAKYTYNTLEGPWLSFIQWRAPKPL